MYIHQVKACLTARWIYACLQTNQVYVSKKHDSTEVVTICMLLLKWDMSTINLWVMGSTPVRISPIAQWLEQQKQRRFESCSLTFNRG